MQMEGCGRVLVAAVVTRMKIRKTFSKRNGVMTHRNLGYIQHYILLFLRHILEESVRLGQWLAGEKVVTNNMWPRIWVATLQNQLSGKEDNKRY
jgi:hypothetical protein